MQNFTHSKLSSNIVESENDRETFHAIKFEGPKIDNLLLNKMRESIWRPFPDHPF